MGKILTQDEYPELDIIIIMELSVPPNQQLTDSDRLTFQRIIDRISQSDSSSSQNQNILQSWLPYALQSADPLMVMVNFERFIQQLDPASEEISLLLRTTRPLEILQKVFSSSRYLSEILIRHPASIIPLSESRILARPKSHDQLYSEALTTISNIQDYRQRLNALRSYQSSEILRIGVCDLTDLYDLWAVTRQLSNLADAIVRTCLRIASDDLRVDANTLTVLGMGKLGGRELNYSSDIDLIFVSDADAHLAESLGKKLIDALSTVTENGFLYRVDMRLRPWGRVGPLVSNREGFLKYLQNHARHWEKQALQKVRVIAGNLVTGRLLLDQVQPFITGGDYSDLQAYVRGMRQKTVAKLEETGTYWGEVKQGQGSIRDVEFTVQFLQMVHGQNNPEILTPNTVDGLNRLVKNGIIQPDEYRILLEGYIFQRTIEHFLQLLDYRQIHQIPSDPQSRDQLARRLGFDGDTPGEKLVTQYEHQVLAINQIYLKYLGDETRYQVEKSISPTTNVSDPVHSHIRRLTGSYQDLYSPEEINRHAAAASQLSKETPVSVEADLIGGNTWRVTIVAYDFPGELSVITGLLFVYKLDILNGEAFTYKYENSQNRKDSHRKIVDVFYVQPILDQQISEQMWADYRADLTRYHHLVRQGKYADVQGDLTRRFAAGMMLLEPGKKPDQIPALYPIKLEVDNDSSEDCTVLRIDALDTTGFLFEFTYALALNGIYIDRVMIDTIGRHVQDILFVTDTTGQKITDPNRQQEMKTATLLIKQFTHLLPFSPNPESALIHFRGFIEQLFQRPGWTEELVSLQKPEVMQALARLLGVSDFLWEDFLRLQYSNLFPVVTDIEALQIIKTKDQLQAEISLLLREHHPTSHAPDQNAAWIEPLTAWRDREMLRIDMRHILGHNLEFWDFAGELSDLAEVIVNAVFHLCHEDLRFVHGTPYKEDGKESRMVVLALGKFGGRELGFASDIELMFVYEKNGMTDGPQPISSAEFFERLVENFAKSMRARREGIFQIDLQLRPYGKNGNLAVSLDSFKKYFSPGGPAWSYERQALVKLRLAAGDSTLGEIVANLRDAYCYTENPFDALSMRAMRERQIRHLVKAGSFNLKYSMGGLVDVEYLVQGLQIAYGFRHPEIRLTNTRLALTALREAGILQDIDFINLKKAHTFLRWMIDSLRVVRGNAKDVTVPPDGSDELAFLARRMRYGEDVSALKRDLLLHQANVQEINQRLLR